MVVNTDMQDVHGTSRRRRWAAPAEHQETEWNTVTGKGCMAGVR